MTNDTEPYEDLMSAIQSGEITNGTELVVLWDGDGAVTDITFHYLDDYGRIHYDDGVTGRIERIAAWWMK